MLSILPILLVTVLTVVLMFGASLIYRYTERNRLQKTLIIILVLWALMFAGLMINLIRVYDGHTTPVSGIMNFHNIVLGLIGLFSLLSYSVVAIHPRLISVRNSLLFLSPVLLSLLVYILWHLATGTPMNYRYLTMEELWAARWTFPVVLRTLMLSFFGVYLFVMLRSVWLLVPIYDKYSEGTYGDMAYNVKWLRMVVIATGAICIAYLIVLIWKSSVSEIFYTITTCVCLTMLTDNAVFHKVFQEPEAFRVTWSLRRGWHEVPVEAPIGLRQETSGGDLDSAVETWMYEKKPFYDSDFSFKDVAAKFPGLDYHTFSDIMAERNLTFQSYVRQHRIEEACRLMQTDPAMLIKAIAFEVGFSHYTSFTRSFVAVMEETPSQYRERISSKH